MRIRGAQPEDAPAMGRLMVASWLSAHRGQVPDEAWRLRSVEWTPEVSARGWARVLAARDGTPGAHDVLLVAEDDGGAIVGLAYADEELTGWDVSALYVAPDRHREGVGRALLRATAGVLAGRGVVELRVSVLTANLPARAFYEALGAAEVGTATTDEEGHLLPTTVYEWADVTVLAGG